VPEVTLTGFLDVPADRRLALLPLLAEHVRLTRAEPGCLAFEVTETAPGSGRFAVTERFADRAAFQAHQRRAAASPWGEATRGFRRDYAVREAG
jgi:quinol monooxygenase YgiN